MDQFTDTTMDFTNIPEWAVETPNYSIADFDFEAYQNAQLQDTMLSWDLPQSLEPQQPSSSCPLVNPEPVGQEHFSFSPSLFSPVIPQEQTYFTEAPLNLKTLNYEGLLVFAQKAQQAIEELRNEIAALRPDTEPKTKLEDDFKTIEVDEPILDKKVPKNARPMNILAFKPKKYYYPLPTKGPWMAPSGYTFHYTADGELDPQIHFSPTEILDFLYNHPEHGRFKGYPPTHSGSGLTIWIQNTPADAVNRYPTATSSKCRFATCPVPGNTIKKGEFRVCFDEWDNWIQQGYPELKKDPYHNAGYVHLYCLEKELDFATICKNFNVQGDNRKFVEERNKMAITRDYESMLDIVNEYIRKAIPRVGLRADDWYDHTLCLALTREHLAKEPRKRQSVREQRNGNSIDRHLNNLDKMVREAAAIKQRKGRLTAKQKGDDEGSRKSMRFPKASKKRGARDMEKGYESDPDSKWEEQNRLFKRSRINIGLE